MKTRPVVAEIIGVSGAGKSTLSGALNSRETDIRAGLTVWGLPFPSLMVSAFFSLPSLISLYLDRWHVRRDELKQIIRLTAFYRLLKKETAGRGKQHYKAFLLDEGVVFALAKLHADAGRHFRGRLMKKWERKALDRWATMLDAVIWLDAPDPLLIERIRTRAKLHRMKDKSDEEIHRFLAQYRAAYEFVVSELEKRRDLKIVRFDTENLSSDRMAEEILCLINETEKTPVYQSVWQKGVTNEKAIQ